MNRRDEFDLNLFIQFCAIVEIRVHTLMNINFYSKVWVSDRNRMTIATVALKSKRGD